jgi:hypothetical protein
VIDEQIDAIEAALKGAGLRTTRDVGGVTQPPCAVIAPPTYQFDGYRSEASAATVPVALVERQDSRSMARLAELLPVAIDALYPLTNSALVSATPGTWPSNSGADLPCYLLEIEVSP